MQVTDTSLLSHANHVPIQMIAVGLLLLAAHLGGKLTDKLGLSDVTGQLLGGIMVGPYALGLLGIFKGPFEEGYNWAFQSFHFFTIVFLCVVAFGIGEELLFERIKRVGRAAVVISCIEATSTWVLITVSFYYIGEAPLLRAMLIGSIGTATAPAVTFVLIHKLHIKGRLKALLANMVVLDDLIEVLVFSFFLQLSHQKIVESDLSLGRSLLPVGRDIILAILIGLSVYVLLRILVAKYGFKVEKDEEDEGPDEVFLEHFLIEPDSPSIMIFILVMGLITLASGIGYYFHLPFLISAIVAGFLIANYHSHTIFDSLRLNNITPFLGLIFFALIGANVSFKGLSLGILLFVVLYIVSRTIGKLLGTWVGCIIMKEEKEVRQTLPFLMLPQAGVAAVESVLAGIVLNDPRLTTIILPAIVFFEVGGVIVSSYFLKRFRKNNK